MPGPTSKQSRALANVRLQLRTGNTRGNNPRPLIADEIKALEQKAARLQEEMAEARHQRTVASINSHSTQEAESTRAAVRNEGQLTRQALQPIAALVVGEGDDVDDRIRAKRNQIALLRAGVREDLAAKKREREQARAASHSQGAGSRRKQARPAVVQTTLLPEDEPVEEGQPEEEDLSEPVESEAGEQAEEAQDGSKDSSTDVSNDASNCLSKDSSNDSSKDSSNDLQVAAKQPIEGVLPGPEAAKDSEELRVVVIAMGGERLAVQQHVLLRTTEACELARTTVMVKAGAILDCQRVKEFKGDVHAFGKRYDRLLPIVWQDINRHLHYGKPTEDMADLWSEFQTLVVARSKMTMMKGLSARLNSRGSHIAATNCTMSRLPRAPSCTSSTERRANCRGDA